MKSFIKYKIINCEMPEVTLGYSVTHVIGIGTIVICSDSTYYLMLVHSLWQYENISQMLCKDVQ